MKKERKNMKKLCFALALAGFFSGAFAAAPANENAEKVVHEGALLIVTPQKPPRGLAGTEWVKHWGLAGHAGIENGKIAMKEGVIYGYMVFPSKTPRKITVTIKASAGADKKKAVLDGYFSTCVREAGNRKPFSHDKKTKFGPFPLEQEEKEYKVEFDQAAFEQGYLYIGGKNLVISFIRVVSAPAPAAAAPAADKAK